MDGDGFSNNSGGIRNPEALVRIVNTRKVAVRTGIRFEPSILNITTRPATIAIRLMNTWTIVNAAKLIPNIMMRPRRRASGSRSRRSSAASREEKQWAGRTSASCPCRRSGRHLWWYCGHRIRPLSGRHQNLCLFADCREIAYMSVAASTPRGARKPADSVVAGLACLWRFLPPHVYRCHSG